MGLWQIVWSIVSLIFFGQAWHNGGSALSSGSYFDAGGAVVFTGISGLFAYLAGIKSLFTGGTSAEFQTAVAELKNVFVTLIAYAKNVKDFGAGKAFLVALIEAAVATGNVFIADEEWSKAATDFLALTHAKLDNAAPKTAAGKPVPPGMISLAEAVGK